MLQCEDEIAGIGACVGASFAGKKALTATSGPGMSLKTEMLGLATIAELPLVVVNVQRGGPSTGIPTKSEQSDLFQAVVLGARRRACVRCWRPPAWPTRSRHRRGVQHRRALPDAGHHPLRPGDRAAQGSDRPTDTRELAHRAREAHRGRARGLRALPPDRVGRQPDQPPGHEGRQLPGVGHRAHRERRADGERRDAREDEREAAAQADTRSRRARSVRDRGPGNAPLAHRRAGDRLPASRSRRSSWRARPASR